MLKRGLNLLTIIFLVSLFSSCQSVQWDWQPDAYVPSTELGGIINQDGVVVYFDDPAFNDFTAFPKENLQALMENIKKLPLLDKHKKQILDMVEGCLPENVNLEGEE